LPIVDSSRDALLASIRGAGGIKSLKKTDKSQLERPSVLLQEARGETPTSTQSNTAAPGGGQPATLADALSAALSQRKGKVAQSDDEDDDDW
jgi:Wiskott-Aldrich syndrome protein